VQSPAAPAGNPYGSFVSQPAARQDPGYGAYESQPASGVNGYYPSSNGYRAGPLSDGSYTGDPAASGTTVDGGSMYNGLAGPDGPYSYEHPSYPRLPSPSEAAYHQASYQAAQYDQAGYGQDSAYGRDTYQGYPGYGTGGY
jgi:hypothetical protein